MSFDLLLDLDDDLADRLRAIAVAEGRSMEDLIRQRILEGAGQLYRPLTEADEAVMLPMVHLDLRTQ